MSRYEHTNWIDDKMYAFEYYVRDLRIRREQKNAMKKLNKKRNRRLCKRGIFGLILLKLAWIINSHDNNEWMRFFFVNETMKTGPIDALILCVCAEQVFQQTTTGRTKLNIMFAGLYTIGVFSCVIAVRKPETYCAQLKCVRFAGSKGRKCHR